MDDPSSWTGLLTDRYELTMLEAALADGTASRRCVFEVFTRRLPPGRRYGVVAGTARLLDALGRFRFDEQALAWLAKERIVGPTALAFLNDYTFNGGVWGYPEGECHFPGSPVLVVEGTFAEAVVLETLVLSVLNHDSAIASAASRMTAAAGDRPCIEMGGRRTHEDAAVAAARAAYVAGFQSTSNLEAGRRFGIPTRGTAAHAFTLLHDDEESAFTSQVATLGTSTTLLVDTFDVERGVDRAVRVAGPGLGAVRLDSGDLIALAHEVRARLDELGAQGTKIVVTSDLDEHAIAALASAPVDAYGVGTQLVGGSGAPTAGFVFKLAARQDASGTLVPVEKTSPAKHSRGGRKQAHRLLDDAGRATTELISPVPGERASTDERPLQVPLVLSGETVWTEGAAQARARHRSARAELPPAAAQLSPGDPVITTVFATGRRREPR